MNYYCIDIDRGIINEINGDVYHIGKSDKGFDVMILDCGVRIRLYKTKSDAYDALTTILSLLKG